MSKKEKLIKSKPVIIAPTMLVATKVIARSTTENKTVPNAPASVAPNAVSTQHAFFSDNEKDNNAATINTTAIPKVAHKNIGGTVMTAVILRKAVIIPITKLITNATPRHSNFLLHILFTPIHIMKICIKSEKGDKAAVYSTHYTKKQIKFRLFTYLYFYLYML